MTHRPPPRAAKPQGAGPPRQVRPVGFPPMNRLRPSQTQPSPTAGSNQQHQNLSVLLSNCADAGSLAAARTLTRMQILESLAESIPSQQMAQIMSNFGAECVGLGGSTGDSNVGEQSQGSLTQQNPGETASAIENMVFQKTGSNATGGQYSIMARKVCDYIKRNKVKLADVGDDVAAFVSQATSNRRPVPSKGSGEGVGGASSNPFAGGFQVRKPEGSGVAQGGMSRQKAPRPRFAATQFAAMPTTSFVPPVEAPQQRPESPQKVEEETVPDQSSAVEDFVQPRQDGAADNSEPVGNATSLFGGEVSTQSDSGAQTHQDFASTFQKQHQNQQSKPQDISASLFEQTNGNSQVFCENQVAAAEPQKDTTDDYFKQQEQSQIRSSSPPHKQQEMEPVYESGNADVLFGGAAQVSVQQCFQNAPSDPEEEQDMMNYFNQPASPSQKQEVKQQWVPPPQPQQIFVPQNNEPINQHEQEIKSETQSATASAFFQTENNNNPFFAGNGGTSNCQGQVEEEENGQVSTAQALFGGASHGGNAFAASAMEIQTAAPRPESPQQQTASAFFQSSGANNNNYGVAMDDEDDDDYFSQSQQLKQQVPVQTCSAVEAPSQSSQPAVFNDNQFNNQVPPQSQLREDSQLQYQQQEQASGLNSEVNSSQNECTTQVYRGFQQEEVEVADDINGEERGSNSGEGHFDQSNCNQDGFENFEQARPQTLFDLQEQQNSQEWRDVAAPQSQPLQQQEKIPVAASCFADEQPSGGKPAGFPAKPSGDSNANEKQTAAVFFAAQSNNNVFSESNNQAAASAEQDEDSTKLASAFFSGSNDQPQPQLEQQPPIAARPARAEMRNQTNQGSSAFSLFSNDQQPNAEATPQVVETQQQISQIVVPDVAAAPLQLTLTEHQSSTSYPVQTEPSPKMNARPPPMTNIQARPQGISSSRHKPNNSMSATIDEQASTPTQRKQSQPNFQRSEAQVSQSMVMSPRQDQMQHSGFNTGRTRVNTDKTLPQGFIQAYPSSKPPQSVASINFSTMEDSESLIRAYKKKKAELETLRDSFYQIETQLFTVSKQHMILDEENSALKTRVSDLERLLKESQKREIMRESADAMSKQLSLKTVEVEMYQNQVQHQKAINLKLQEKMKELVQRKSFTVNQASAAQRDKMQSSQPEIVHSDFNM